MNSNNDLQKLLALLPFTCLSNHYNINPQDRNNPTFYNKYVDTNEVHPLHDKTIVSDDRFIKTYKEYQQYLNTAELYCKYYHKPPPPFDSSAETPSTNHSSAQGTPSNSGTSSHNLLCSAQPPPPPPGNNGRTVYPTNNNYGPSMASSTLRRKYNHGGSFVSTPVDGASDVNVVANTPANNKSSVAMYQGMMSSYKNNASGISRNNTASAVAALGKKVSADATHKSNKISSLEGLSDLDDDDSVEVVEEGDLVDDEILSCTSKTRLSGITTARTCEEKSNGGTNARGGQKKNIGGPFVVGDVVDVTDQSMIMGGNGDHGGVAMVTKVHESGESLTYDVMYATDSREEKGVEEYLLLLHEEKAPTSSNKKRKKKNNSDTNAPPKGRTARKIYQFDPVRRREFVHPNNEKVGYNTMTTMLGLQYDDLSDKEKAPYVEAAEKEKNRYLAWMESTRQPPKKSKPSAGEKMAAASSTTEGMSSSKATPSQQVKNYMEQRRKSRNNITAKNSAKDTTSGTSKAAAATSSKTSIRKKIVTAGVMGALQKQPGHDFEQAVDSLSIADRNKLHEARNDAVSKATASAPSAAEGMSSSPKAAAPGVTAAVLIDTTKDTTSDDMSKVSPSPSKSPAPKQAPSASKSTTSGPAVGDKENEENGTTETVGTGGAVQASGISSAGMMLKTSITKMQNDTFLERSNEIQDAAAQFRNNVKGIIDTKMKKQVDSIAVRASEAAKALQTGNSSLLAKKRKFEMKLANRRGELALEEEGSKEANKYKVEIADTAAELKRIEAQLDRQAVDVEGRLKEIREVAMGAFEEKKEAFTRHPGLKKEYMDNFLDELYTREKARLETLLNNIQSPK